MRRIIPQLFKFYNPEFVVYQAGVDGHHSDLLGNLILSLDGLYERDRIIRNLTKNIPVAVIRGGGYNDNYAPKANINTLAAFADLPIIYSHKKKVTEPKRSRRFADKKISELMKLLGM